MTTYQFTSRFIGRRPSHALRHRQTSGFTLLEILMATAVFSIGIAGSVGLMGWINRAGAFNSRIIQATAAGQAVLEEIRNGGYADARSGTDTNGMFDMSWTVATGSSLMKTVSLSVSWENQDGISKSVDVSTILTDETVVSVIPGFALPGNGSGGVMGGGGEEPESGEGGGY